MVQRDYILRLIEQLGPGAAALLRSAEQRKGLQYREAGRTIDQALRQYFGLDTEAVRGLSAEELVALVRLGHSPLIGSDALVDKLGLLAALLGEQAELDTAQGDPEGGADCALRALQISLIVLTEDDPNAARAVGALDPLLGQLAGYELPRPTMALLWRHYERAGEYGRAEDWLFTLLDDDPAALPEALAFYERLASRSDRELARGNLPREEVAAGLAELRARA